MKALTCGNAPADYPANSAGISAAKRLSMYRGRITEAEDRGAGFRSLLWIRVGWLVAEAAQSPAEVQSFVLGQIDKMLADLNRRSAHGGDSG